MNVIKINKFIFFIVFKRLFNKGNRKHFFRVPIELNRGDFCRRCTKIVRARRLFPANFAFRCFAEVFRIVIDWFLKASEFILLEVIG